MQPKNYAALCLLGAVIFFERLAYYAFRGTVYLRLHEEIALSSKDVGVLMSFASAILLVGFVLGGALSIGVRSRFLLLGATVGLTVAHVAGAFSPRLGLTSVALFAGFVRPLIFMALAEEIDREGRVWKAVAVAAGLTFVSNVAASLGAVVGGVAHTRGTTHGGPVLVMFFALVAAAAIALALPGQPFAWGVGDTLVPGQSGLYRPEPTVVRAPRAPNPLLLVFACGAAVLAASEQGVQSHAFFSTLVLHGERSSLMSNIAQIANPVIVCTVSLLLGGTAMFLASRRSRVSATWGLGVGLVLLATSAFVMAISVFAKSTGLGLLSMAVDGLGEALFLPIAMAYALAVPSSRWAGFAAAGYSVVVFLPNLVVSPIAASLEEGLAPALVLLGIVTLVGGGAVLALAPKLERAEV